MVLSLLAWYKRVALGHTKPVKLRDSLRVIAELKLALII